MEKELSILRFGNNGLDLKYNGYLFPIFTFIVPSLQVTHNITYFTAFNILENEFKVWEAEESVYYCSVNIYTLDSFDTSVMTDKLILGNIIHDARKYTLDFISTRLDECKSYITNHPTEFASKHPTIKYLLRKLDKIKKDPPIKLDECYVRKGFR